MLIGTQEMQGAYELAKRVKKELKDIPRKGNSVVYKTEGIVIEYVIKLIDNRLEKMKIECQKQLDEQAKEMV